MSGKAAKVIVTERQFAILEQISKASTTSQQLIQRANIILLGFAKSFNENIAQQVGLNRQQVGLWRRRWACSFDALGKKGGERDRRKSIDSQPSIGQKMDIDPCHGVSKCLV